MVPRHRQLRLSFKRRRPLEGMCSGRMPVNNTPMLGFAGFLGLVDGCTERLPRKRLPSVLCHACDAKGTCNEEHSGTTGKEHKFLLFESSNRMGDKATAAPPEAPPPARASLSSSTSSIDGVNSTCVVDPDGAVPCKRPTPGLVQLAVQSLFLSIVYPVFVFAVSRCTQCAGCSSPPPPCPLGPHRFPCHPACLCHCELQLWPGWAL
jgi:hypothetical protein